jgi:hypothetical protein
VVSCIGFGDWKVAVEKILPSVVVEEHVPNKRCHEENCNELVRSIYHHLNLSVLVCVSIWRSDGHRAIGVSLFPATNG